MGLKFNLTRPNLNGLLKPFCKLGLLGLLLIFNVQEGFGQIRISFFGDSLVQGFGLYPEDGMVSQMQNLLDQKGIEVTLVNSGVSGDTTAGGLARLDWTLADGFDGIIILLGGNDLLRGIDYNETRANLTGIMEILKEKEIPALLIGHEAPSNFGPEYKREFERIYTDLSAEYGVLLFPRVFAPIQALGTNEDVRLEYFQDDQLHPNTKGVQIIVNALEDFVLMLLEQISNSHSSDQMNSMSN
ncbi:MAG: arylesterase [Rhodobacteraceae bacterium]|nr:arylesterase [Paracoccaceae bacterium]